MANRIRINQIEKKRKKERKSENKGYSQCILYILLSLLCTKCNALRTENISFMQTIDSLIEHLLTNQKFTSSTNYTHFCHQQTKNSIQKKNKKYWDFKHQIRCISTKASQPNIQVQTLESNKMHTIQNHMPTFLSKQILKQKFLKAISRFKFLNANEYFKAI